MKLWYKDSMVVEEIKAVHINSVNGTTATDTSVAYYVFIDLPTKSFYHYSSFSDTAQLIEYYTQEDSLQMRGIGGWPFYRNIDLNVVEAPGSLKDTTINDIRFKRRRFTQLNNGTYSYLIGYFRCDRKGTLFQFHKNLSLEIGCPMVRTDYLPTPANQFPISSEIHFLNNRLSDQELKVFEAWRRNADAKRSTQ